jgi:hypothetical protein
VPRAREQSTGSSGVQLAAAARGGAWSSDGQILFGSLAGGMYQVPASGGTPSSLTTPDAVRGEYTHRWPQMLPGGRFLYLVQSDKPGNTGIYASSFAKSSERVRLLTTDYNAVLASGNGGKSYLLWLRGWRLAVLQPIVKGGATARLRSGQIIEISRRYAQALRHKLDW